MTPLLALLVLSSPVPTPDKLVSFDAAQARRTDPTIDVTAETDPRVRRVALDALLLAFAKYPRKSLLDHLRAVYVVRSLSSDGTSMGGTNAPEAHSI